MTTEKPRMFTAKLIRGNLWMLKDISFPVGVEVVIDDDIYDQLYAHGVDYVKSGDGDTDEKSKFEYRPYDGDLPVGAQVTPVEADKDENARPPRVRDRGLPPEPVKAPPVARNRQRA